MTISPKELRPKYYDVQSQLSKSKCLSGFELQFSYFFDSDHDLTKFNPHLRRPQTGGGRVPWLQGPFQLL